MKFIINRYKLQSILIFLLVTICYSNCTAFRYIYVKSLVWCLLIILSIIICGFKLIKNKNSIKVYGLFLIFIFINYIFSNYKIEMLKYILIFLLFFVLYSTKFTQDDLDFFVKLCGWFATFVACTIIIEFFSNHFCTNYLWFLGTPYPFERAQLISQKDAELAIQAYSGVAFEKADAAYYMVLGIIAKLSSAYAVKSIRRKDVLLTILYLIAILLTGKRMLIICAVLCIFVMFLISQEKNKLLKIIKWTGIILICCIFIVQIPIVQHMMERFLSATTGSDGALLERYVKWSYAFKLFEISPFWGHGFGTYNVAAVEVGYAASFFAHNIYIQLLADCGAIGILFFGLLAFYNLWVAIDLCYFKRSVLTVKELRVVLFSFSVQILILVYGLSGNTIFYVFQLTMYLFCFIISDRVRCNLKNRIFYNIPERQKYD